MYQTVNTRTIQYRAGLRIRVELTRIRFRHQRKTGSYPLNQFYFAFFEILLRYLYFTMTLVNI